MATSTPERIYSLPAAADFSAIKYPRFIVQNVSGQVALPAAGARALGIMSNNPKAGEQARYEWGGNHRVESAEALTAGDKVTTDNTGKAILADTAGHAILGTVHVDSLSGEVVTVQWDPDGVVPA